MVDVFEPRCSVSTGLLNSSPVHANIGTSKEPWTLMMTLTSWDIKNNLSKTYVITNKINANP